MDKSIYRDIVVLLPEQEFITCFLRGLFHSLKLQEIVSKLNPAFQFSNLKPKLKIWEILTVDV